MVLLDRRTLSVKLATLFTLAAFLLPLSAALLSQHIALPSSGSIDLSIVDVIYAPPPTRAGFEPIKHLETRAKKQIVRKKGCEWASRIEGTDTKPMSLVIGLVCGIVGGMVIFAFACYQYGRSAMPKGGAGGMGGGMGGY